MVLPRRHRSLVQTASVLGMMLAACVDGSGTDRARHDASGEGGRPGDAAAVDATATPDDDGDANASDSGARATEGGEPLRDAALPDGSLDGGSTDASVSDGGVEPGDAAADAIVEAAAECDGDCPCADASVPSELRERSVDVIWVIDNSASMVDDFEDLSSGLTDFVERAAEGGYDLHGVWITAAPLESHLTTDYERYLLRRVDVGSWNALQVLVDDYDNYAHFLRQDSAVHVVVSSDDGSETAPDDFTTQMQAKLGRPFRFHAVTTMQETYAGLTEAYGDLASSTGGLDVRITSDFGPPLEQAVRESATYCAPLDSP